MILIRRLGQPLHTDGGGRGECLCFSSSETQLFIERFPFLCSYEHYRGIGCDLQCMESHLSPQSDPAVSRMDHRHSMGEEDGLGKDRTGGDDFPVFLMKAEQPASMQDQLRLMKRVVPGQIVGEGDNLPQTFPGQWVYFPVILLVPFIPAVGFFYVIRIHLIVCRPFTNHNFHQLLDCPQLFFGERDLIPMKILSGKEIFQISVGAGGIRVPTKIGEERSPVAASQEEVGGNPEEISDFPQQD